MNHSEILLLMCCCADSFPGDPEPSRRGGRGGKSQEIPGEILGKDPHPLHQSLVCTELWWNPFKGDFKQRCKLTQKCQKCAAVSILQALYCSLYQYFCSRSTLKKKKSLIWRSSVCCCVCLLFPAKSRRGLAHGIIYTLSQVKSSTFLILFKGKHGCHTSRNVHV